jgi:hypothetical protein
MKFSLVQIWCSYQDGNDVCKSLIIKSGFAGSLAVDKPFDSKEKMIEIMNGILATQEGNHERDIIDALTESKIGVVQYTGETQLDLTDEQAESLGWKTTNEKATR